MSDVSLPVPDELVDALAEAIAGPVADRLLEPILARLEAKAGDNGRLAFTVPELAKALGVSPDHVTRHVLPELDVIRCGSKRIIPASEVDRWIRDNAGRVDLP